MAEGLAQPLDSSRMDRSNVTLEDAAEGMRAVGWAIQFDKLLGDRAGVATFTAYLKTILCAENITFWIKCEQYKQLQSDDQRRLEAMRMYADHLDPSAQEQVNVDEQTRLMVKSEVFSNSSASCFDRAQKHIYILMKENCYKRFLSSDIYKQAVSAEMAGKPFPFSGQPLEQMPPPSSKREDLKAAKKRKLSKAQEDPAKENRRRSLLSWLPWNTSKSEKDSPPKKKMTKNEEMFNKAMNTPSTTVALDEKPKDKRSSSGLFDFRRRSSLGPKLKGKSKAPSVSEIATFSASKSSSDLPKSAIKSKLTLANVQLTKSALAVPSAVSNVGRGGPNRVLPPKTFGYQHGEMSCPRTSERKSLDLASMAHNRSRLDDQRAGARLSMQRIPEFLSEKNYKFEKQPANRSFDNFLDTENTFSVEDEEWNGQIFPYIDDEEECLDDPCLVRKSTNIPASATRDSNVKSKQLMTSKIPVPLRVLQSRTPVRCSYRKAIESEEISAKQKRNWKIGEMRGAALGLPKRSEKMN